LEKVRVSIIAGVAENGVIGAGDRMPWRLSSDLKRFKAITMGKPVIMGRKTFETIGKPLPGRTNIVVSRAGDLAVEGVVVAPNLEAAMARAREEVRASADPEFMVIGGGEIYRAAIDLADRLYITHVDAAPDGDTFFPAIDPAIWQGTEVERTSVGPKDSVATTFVIYDRVAPEAPE
jgi:dihydrofolate reductase